MALNHCKQLDTKIDNPEIDAFFNSFDTVLCDVDGVLRTGSRVIEGSPEAIKGFRKLGKDVIYMSNSCLHSRKDYLRSLTSMGYNGKIDDIFTASFACVQYLKDIGFSKTVYVLGPSAIGEELDEAGIKHIGCGTDETPDRWYDPLIAKDVAESMSDDVGCVIVGLTYDVSYIKLVKAVSYLSKPDVLFLGTHQDTKFPITKGYIVPADGAFISFIQTATGKDPIVIGKPNKFMFNALKSIKSWMDPSRVLMIGDTPPTDMLFARVCGLKSLMVGTGVGKYCDIEKWEETPNEETMNYIPDYFIDKLGDFISHFERYNPCE